MSEKLCNKLVNVFACGVVVPIVGCAHMCIGGALGVVDALLFDVDPMNGPCAKQYEKLFDSAMDKLLNWANDKAE